MRPTETVIRLPGILRRSSLPVRLRTGASTMAFRELRRARFTQQSHILGAPIASPRALFIAATVAVALYLIGSRLSD